MNENDGRIEEKVIEKSFKEFLEYEKYQRKINSMLSDVDDDRLIINYNELANTEFLATELIKNPTLVLPCFERSLKDLGLKMLEDKFKNDTVKVMDTSELEKLKQKKWKIGIEGIYGRQKVTPRGLNSKLIRTLVCVEGIVTKCSLIKPKLIQSFHYCPGDKTFYTKDYSDSTDISSKGINSVGIYPTKSEDGKPLKAEFGYFKFKDHQTLTIQEMPEKAPPGQLPRSIEVIIDEDLVDKAKPGDRLQVVGCFISLPSKSGNDIRGRFKTVVVANNIRLLTRNENGPTLTDEDIKNIKEHSKQPKIFSKIAKSMAPSIYGHKQVKRALLLQMLGGCEHNLKNGTHIRGDINLMLIGDPSTAKSQLLRFVINTAPLVVSTSGRGSSGVGLTAAVTKDPETNERRLEAGAMVLADRGLVCIDEFDKMLDHDRVAIHEVMEQQTVTISKAGIHTSLNARCSVLAAANPIYGHYNVNKKPSENISLPDSLLSRFDLLFIILDKMEEENDRNIAKHVLRMRCSNVTTNVNPQSNFDDPTFFDDSVSKTAPIFVKNKYGTQNSSIQTYTIDFIKKYIMYAKNRIRPVLTEGACNLICEIFPELRQNEGEKTLPVTPRTLESLIRLTIAHAKCRLSDHADEDDVKSAYKLVSFALFHEEAPKKKKMLNEINNNNNNNNNNNRNGSISQIDKFNNDSDKSISNNNHTIENNVHGDMDDDRDDGKDDVDDDIQIDHKEIERFKSGIIKLKIRDSIDYDELLIKLNDNNQRPFSKKFYASIVKHLEQDGYLTFDDDSNCIFLS